MTHQSQSCPEFLFFILVTSFAFIFISAGVASITFAIALIVVSKRVAIGSIWIAISIILMIVYCCCVKKSSKCSNAFGLAPKSSISQGMNTVEPLPQQPNTSLHHHTQLENQVFNEF